jgi:hypothetical protein
MPDAGIPIFAQSNIVASDTIVNTTNNVALADYIEVILNSTVEIALNGVIEVG